ncbi:MAG: hypothetical protein ACJ8KU_04250 [Chthoniobacterales bacterium]
MASVPGARAGTEVVEPDYAPAPRYSYAPPQPQPVYYAPPVVSVGIYPAFGFYARPYRYYGYRHHYAGRRYYRGRYWR